MLDKGPYCYCGDWEAGPEHTISVPDSIHPKDLQKWVSALGQDARVWTNNTMIVDCFAAENVWLCRLDKNENAIRKQLSSHPNWPRWRQEIWPGEFWSIYGDDWVLK